VDATRHPLEIRPIHRAISGLRAGRAAELAAAHAKVDETTGEPFGTTLARLADIDGPAFVLEGENRRWLVQDVDRDLIDRTVPREPPAPWRRLDATVLDHVFIPHVWGVADPATAVSHHHDAHPALRQATATDGTAVLMRAVDVTTVLELARQGIRMPRKSTSFCPKPRSGFVLRTFGSG
jgi:hypothetical protein